MSSRAKAAREARRAAQFNKFRFIQLNLVPLVDTFVSIVFFALTTQTLGELAPLVSGVNLPTSNTDRPAAHELTLGIASRPAVITLAGNNVMSVQQAAQAVSNLPNEPLLIPQLYSVLRTHADSIRQADDIPANQSVNTTLAIQADKGMRYDLLSRVLHTARKAGFKNVSLQVMKGTATTATPAAS